MRSVERCGRLGLWVEMSWGRVGEDNGEALNLKEIGLRCWRVLEDWFN